MSKNNNSNVKKIGNDIWNWLNGPEEEEEAAHMSFFQRSAMQNRNSQLTRQNRQGQQQLYDTKNSPMSPLDTKAPEDDSKVPLRRATLDEEIEDYDFYSSDHLDKIFDVVIEIQEEYDKKKKEEQMKLMQSQKANQEKVPKALLNPEVQRQIKKQKTYKPIFLVTLTVIQIIIMIAEMGVNWINLGTPIDFKFENIMIGPSKSVSIIFYF